MTRAVRDKPAPNRHGAPATWRLQHKQDAADSLRRLLATPLSSLMTVFVIAIAMLLPSLVLLINSNLGNLLEEFRGSARLTLYLEEATTETEAIAVSEYLLTLDGIESVEFISQTKALEDFSVAAGLRDVLASFSENPLPASLVVTPAEVSADVVEALATELAARPEVALVQVDQQWIQRLEALADLLRVVARTLGVIVVLGVAFIVGNTIRLSVENHRDEIRVIKLVGGSDGFIARPFLYTGLYYGVCGGVLALLMLLLIGLPLAAPLRALTGPGASALTGLSPAGALLPVLAGAVVGWAAALIASRRCIRTIDP